ncbi:NAD(P)-dependent malic enzyme [Erysipelothrix aquatica]|uniref:NAD(P)-dependent malic enzyme n=1 Tax=Erysipelothrix aquatica TaxID=2683714 RepID=UPI00135BB997|nr:NADP-dependent malic enzyme [Erysipelothrix aquatica]
MTLKEKALKIHKDLQGKVEILNKMPIDSREIFGLLYSPGAAEPTREIQKNPETVYDYTWKQNTIAMVSNGTAVLGLGDVGPNAALPVIEGKSMLFRAFSNVGSVPLVLDTKDPDELIRTVEIIAPTFGGINLEDIKAPECVYIEQELQRRLNIPVFHDDQHGTAIVVLAALMNAFKLIDKDLKTAKVVVSGTGAAGSSVIRMLHRYGLSNIYAYNIDGPVDNRRVKFYDPVVQEICNYIEPITDETTLHDLMQDADIFIGVSAAGVLTQEDVRVMASDAVVFAMANPVPEISYDDAIAAGARIAGTGRSDYPNQVNNVLAFPGIFQGALQAKATEINEEMKIAAAYGIASMIPNNELTDTNILPYILDADVADVVARAVAEKAVAMGVVRK